MNINRTFNNQIDDASSYYHNTQLLKTRIVKQLEGKTQKEQEEIIEGLLKFLDINLLAALALAYSVAPVAAPEERK